MATQPLLPKTPKSVKEFHSLLEETKTHEAHWGHNIDILEKITATFERHFGIDEEHYLPWKKSFSPRQVGLASPPISNITLEDLYGKIAKWFIDNKKRIGFAFTSRDLTGKTTVCIIFQQEPKSRLLDMYSDYFGSGNFTFDLVTSFDDQKIMTVSSNW